MSESGPTVGPLVEPTGAPDDPGTAPVGAAGASLRPPVYAERQLLVLAGILVLFALLPLRYDSNLDLSLVNRWMQLSALGVSFYLVFGVSGVFAFSHTAFFAIGAYTSVWAADGRPFWVGFVVAIVVCALVAIAFMAIVARAAHFYFAIATLAFSFISLVVLTNWESFTAPGGEITTGIGPPTVWGFEVNTPFREYWLMLAMLGGILLLVALFERSPLKREAIANRDNPLAAATAGVPTIKLNFVTFAIGSAMAGAIGSVFAHRVRSLAPDSFSVELGLDIFVIVLLGGIGSMWGAILGAAYIVWFPEWTGALNEYQGIIDGIVVVAVIIFFPTGIIGIWHRLRAAVARRRRPGAGAPSGAPAPLTAALKRLGRA